MVGFNSIDWLLKVTLLCIFIKLMKKLCCIFISLSWKKLFPFQLLEEEDKRIEFVDLFQESVRRIEKKIIMYIRNGGAMAKPSVEDKT
jgi:hypothetical protein